MNASSNDLQNLVVYLSPADERANTATHFFGFVMSLAVGAFFVSATRGFEPGLRYSCLVFCICLAAVYLLSTLSHAVQDPQLRNRLRAWDQGAIYLLIVGTYSPFIWQGTQGSARAWLLLAVWIVALFGFYSKVVATHRVNAVSTVTYLALGWLPAIPLIPSTPWLCFVWMLMGGLCYSLGVVFLKRSFHIRYAHAMWHVMVILGSACHCYAIWLLISASSPGYGNLAGLP